MCRETSAFKNMGLVKTTVNLTANAISDISGAVPVGAARANGALPRLVLGIAAVLVVGLVSIANVIAAWPRDLDGRYANSPLKQWFDQLASGNGLCCSFADGVSIQDVDWDTVEGHYRVRLRGQWIVVPDSAVVTEPNRFGPAVVWPYQDDNNGTKIRCFIPGAGA
jgi:hypothetical protein